MIKDSKKKQAERQAQLKAIGDNIRKYRKQKNMTQTELALECDIADWSQISRMERGVVNFSVSYLLLVAEKLQISPKELLP